MESFEFIQQPYKPQTLKLDDKHKSWYKLDPDGAFITVIKEERFKPYKKKEKKTCIKQQLKLEQKDVSIIRDIEMKAATKPSALDYAHKLIINTSMQMSLALIMILCMYCVFSVIVPVFKQHRRPRI